MSKITRAFATVSGLTILSRILGFAREVLTAQLLGASAVADAFFVALRLPNFLRQVFAEGALSVAFVPIMSQMLAEDPARAKRFAETTLSWLITILIPFCVLMIFIMPYVIPVWLPGDIYAPGTERFTLAVDMARITYPFLLLVSCVALMGGVLNSLHKFVPFAAAPCIFNVVITLFLLLSIVAPDILKYIDGETGYFLMRSGLAKILNAPFITAGHAMAYGLTASGIIQICWMAWFLRRAKFQLRLRLPTLSPEIKRLLVIMLPAAFAGSITQIDLLLGQTIASLLPGGSVSYLYYAERLNQLPIGVLGVAVGTALLPMLARSIKENDIEQSKHYFSRTLEFCLLLGLPTAIAFLILAEPIQITLFQRGEFTMADAHASAYALMSMALGIPAFVVGKAFVTVLFAHQDTKAAIKISAATAATSTGLGFIFVQLAKWLAPDQLVILGVIACALSTSIAGWVNVYLLRRALKKRGLFWLDDACKKNITRMAAAAAAMAIVIFITKQLVGDAFLMPDNLHRLLALAFICGLGGATYMILCFRLGALKIADVKTFLKRAPKQVETRDTTVPVVGDQ